MWSWPCRFERVSSMCLSFAEVLIGGVLTGSYRCRACPVGTFNPSMGGQSLSDCLPCPPGAVTETTGSINGTAACFCSPLEYKSDRELHCFQCPVGAVCGSDSNVCAFNVDPPACSNQSIVGEWKRGSTGEFVLISCPDGYQRINSSARAQQCRPCSEFDYIIDPNRFECQRCPPGLECNGTATVRNKLRGSEWVTDGPVFRLQSCPRGYFVSNETLGTQECRYCGLGEDCEEDECTQCRSCPPGWYKDSISTSACTRCATGSYASSHGSRVCTLCPQFSSTPGTSSTARLTCECEGLTYPAGGPDDFVCASCPLGGVRFSSLHFALP